MYAIFCVRNIVYLISCVCVRIIVHVTFCLRNIVRIHTFKDGPVEINEKKSYLVF